MRADIHGGPEHDTLQCEVGYIEARPTSGRSTKTSCDARPDHTFRATPLPPDSTWNIVEVGDFTGSGNSDIIRQQSTTGALLEWQMNGAQIVSSQTITSQGAPVTPGNAWQLQSKPTDFA